MVPRNRPCFFFSFGNVAILFFLQISFFGRGLKKLPNSGTSEKKSGAPLFVARVSHAGLFSQVGSGPLLGCVLG